MKYHVLVQEVWVRTIEVDAPSPDKAAEIAEKEIQTGAEKEIEFDYSYTLESDHWSMWELENDGTKFGKYFPGR